MTDPRDPTERVFDDDDRRRRASVDVRRGGRPDRRRPVGVPAALVGDVGMFAMQTMSTLPILGGLASIAGARSMAGTPTEVAVGPRGVRVVDGKGEREFAWDEIGWASVGSTGMSQKRELVIFDPGGKAVAKVGDAIDEFDALAAAVTGRVAQKADGTADQIRTSKARKTAWLAGALGVFMWVAAGFLGWNAYLDQRAERLWPAPPCPAGCGPAALPAPNGVTPRLEYEVKGAGGRTATAQRRGASPGLGRPRRCADRAGGLRPGRAGDQPAGLRRGRGPRLHQPADRRLYRRRPRGRWAWASSAWRPWPGRAGRSTLIEDRGDLYQAIRGESRGRLVLQLRFMTCYPGTPFREVPDAEYRRSRRLGWAVR